MNNSDWCPKCGEYHCDCECSFQNQDYDEEYGSYCKEELDDYYEESVKSTGGSSSYYFLPEGAEELQDLIEHK